MSGRGVPSDSSEEVVTVGVGQGPVRTGGGASPGMSPRGSSSVESHGVEGDGGSEASTPRTGKEEHWFWE